MRPLAAAGPATVGPYRILAELGRGGMGRVLLGTGPDGRLVAVKLVHGHFAEDDRFRARFRREVAASSGVSGAYTAAVVDADPDAPTPWLASVFVPGPSLQSVLRAVGPLPVQPVLRLAAGLATALIQIHRAGLVHRDITPSNVLLADDGPRVIDFGIVRAVTTDEPSSELTRTGWLIGSPAFMSPEQARSEPATPASDVFSLAAVVAAACTGSSPFRGAATLQTLNNVAHTAPDLAEVPAAVRRVIEPCLDKDPAQRPTPARLLDTIGPIAPAARPWPAPVHELIEQLRAEVAHLLDPSGDAQPPREPDAVTSLSPPPPGHTAIQTRPEITRRPRRRWLRWAVVPVVVALVAAGGWFLLLPSSPTRLAEMTGNAAFRLVAFSPDGATLAAADQNHTVRVWNIASHAQLGSTIGPLGRDTLSGVSGMSFSPDNHTLIVSRVEEENETAVVQTWSADASRVTGEPFSVEADHALSFGQLQISQDGRSFAVASLDDPENGLQIWDIPSDKQTGSLENAAGLGFSPDGRRLAVHRPQESTVALWNVADRRVEDNPILVTNIDEVAWSPDSRVLVTSTWDGHTGKADLWNADGLTHLRQPVTLSPAGELRQLALSPDTTILATLHGNGDTVRFWNTDTGERIGGTIDHVNYIAFSPDGGTLATADTDNTVRLWRVPSP